MSWFPFTYVLFVTLVSIVWMGLALGSVLSKMGMASRQAWIPVVRWVAAAEAGRTSRIAVLVARTVSAVGIAVLLVGLALRGVQGDDVTALTGWLTLAGAGLFVLGALVGWVFWIIGAGTIGMRLNIASGWVVLAALSPNLWAAIVGWAKIGTPIPSDAIGRAASAGAGHSASADAPAENVAAVESVVATTSIFGDGRPPSPFMAGSEAQPGATNVFDDRPFGAAGSWPAAPLRNAPTPTSTPEPEPEPTPAPEPTPERVPEPARTPTLAPELKPSPEPAPAPTAEAAAEPASQVPTRREARAIADAEELAPATAPVVAPAPAPTSTPPSSATPTPLPNAEPAAKVPPMPVSPYAVPRASRDAADEPGTGHPPTIPLPSVNPNPAPVSPYITGTLPQVPVIPPVIPPAATAADARSWAEPTRAAAVTRVADSTPPMGASSASDEPAEVTTEPVQDDADDHTVITKRRRDVWVLEVDGGDSYPLPEDQITIGRSAAGTARASHVGVDDTTRTMSKQHAKLRLVDGAWLVTDVGSTNGTFVRGADGVEVEVSPGTEAPVDGVLLLGDLEARIVNQGSGRA
ncbi:FHA domain-containing protein [Demequina aurantiaca]|uniref:FHA domain-containing protein n=1 Tax=Demequina aurantiaca TaxID=676200 RepID=UPI003D3313B5